MSNPPPKEDTWAFQPIGAPFPACPVKVLNEPNMYVALWYKHGVPIHGRSWNNAGVVECSFPYKKDELTGAKDLGGQIQVLQYQGDHNSLGYWYEWIQYKNRFDKDDERKMVKCGSSFPIYWKDRKEGALLGYVDADETAHFSHDKIAEQLSGSQLDDMWIIVRNTNGGPPFCDCPHCPKLPPPPPPSSTGSPSPPPPRQMFNQWMDIRDGDPWPSRPLVKALGRSLDTLPGHPVDQFVALWYIQGEPVMGRVWNENGKVAASFGRFGRQYQGNVGSIQVLIDLSENERGFDYNWVPFNQVAVYGKKLDWDAVHVDYQKGFITPCVYKTTDGKEILGKVDIRNEKASAPFNGKENSTSGPGIASLLVLARKAREGYKFD